MSGNGNDRAARWQTYKAVVRGQVTGVGFRYSAVREARRHQHLRGHIRNAGDRAVECIVQGPEDEVRSFLDWLRRGPETARVDSCEVSPVSGHPELPPFTIGY